MLKVIGTGFGRTGTFSLKLALEQLGFGPCYHMMEVFKHPEHIALWHRAATGGPLPDWEALFAGYASTVDWPATLFWRELHAQYPQARFIHTVRDPERWYRSLHDTIYTAVQTEAGADELSRRQREMADQVIMQRTFGGRFADREHAIAVLHAQERAVRETIPPDRLLVFDVAQGWAPLCNFLGCPVPEAPFPRTNTTAEFRAHILGDEARGAAPPGGGD